MKGVSRFDKTEKLKSRKLISQLFSEGKAVSVPMLRLIYCEPGVSLSVPVKTGVSVSARVFKKAADRNRIKRLLREAYRINKTALIDHLSGTNKQYCIFLVFTDKTMPTFGLVNSKMQVILNKFIKATSEAPAKDN